MTARLTIAAARPGMRVLIREIERAGLIAQEPRTTFHLTPQQFQEMHNAG